VILIQERLERCGSLSIINYGSMINQLVFNSKERLDLQDYKVLLARKEMMVLLDQQGQQGMLQTQVLLDQQDQ
jgi:hypothetical protein